MKRILLTSTALVAFTGAAWAEAHEDASGVSFSGDATLGFNDDIEDGFYWDAGLAVTYTAILDNGITATATYEIDISDGNLGNEDLDAGDYVLTVSSDNATLEFGDVDPPLIVTGTM